MAPCSISTPPQHAASWGGRPHRQPFVDCPQMGGGSRGTRCRLAWLVFPAPVLPPRAILVGGFSVPDWTPWLPAASLTCPLPIGSTPGVGISSGRTLGRDLDAPRETEVARSDQLHSAQGRTGVVTGNGRARGCHDGGGQGGHHFLASSRQAGGDLSLTCRASGLDLACGGLVWLDFPLGAGGLRCRRQGPQERFGFGFVGIRVGSPGDPFADLETRQRQKSPVAPIPTASALGSLSVYRMSASRRAFCVTNDQAQPNSVRYACRRTCAAC
jgi:hypothetical protein